MFLPSKLAGFAQASEAFSRLRLKQIFKHLDLSQSEVHKRKICADVFEITEPDGGSGNFRTAIITTL